VWRDKNALFVVVLSRREDLVAIREKYPGGTWRVFLHRSKPDQLSFITYEVRW
jgi:hypothetical protein